MDKLVDELNHKRILRVDNISIKTPGEVSISYERVSSPQSHQIIFFDNLPGTTFMTITGITTDNHDFQINFKCNGCITCEVSGLDCK